MLGRCHPGLVEDDQVSRPELGRLDLSARSAPGRAVQEPRGVHRQSDALGLEDLRGFAAGPKTDHAAAGGLPRLRDDALSHALTGPGRANHHVDRAAVTQNPGDDVDLVVTQGPATLGGLLQGVHDGGLTQRLGPALLRPGHHILLVCQVRQRRVTLVPARLVDAAPIGPAQLVRNGDQLHALHHDGAVPAR